QRRRKMEGEAGVAPAVLGAAGGDLTRRAGHEPSGGQLVRSTLGADAEGPPPHIGQHEGPVHFREARGSGPRRAADVGDVKLVPDNQRGRVEVSAHGRSPEVNGRPPRRLGESCYFRRTDWSAVLQATTWPSITFAAFSWCDPCSGSLNTR